jgi:arylsulfatase A-like enzyme
MAELGMTGLCRIIARLIAIVFAGLSLTTATQAQSAPPDKPNIVYILADDLGWKDVGFHGSDIKTPNINELAQTGAELEQFYVQAMCTQTRAALMTGRYPLRYGLQTLVIPASMTYGLPKDEYLLPQALKSAGYETAIVGKWHLGHASKEMWPMQRGFDYQYGGQVGEIDYFTHKVAGKTDWYRDNRIVNEKGYVTTLIGDDALRLIDRHDPKNPLFMYVAFTAPHAPYQAPQEYIDRYKNIADPNRRLYAAMISAMDDQIGRIKNALKLRGMADNTIIVFHSDNGGNKSALLSGETAVKGPLPADNGPYRGGKGDLYEGGNRAVSLINWPKKIKPGTVINGMMHIVDYYPTLAALAGAGLDKAKPLDGVNQWPMIAEGKPSARNEIVYNVELFRGAVRQDDWKLVWRTVLPSKIELFNLANDPSEKVNLAEQNPQKVQELQKRIGALAEQSEKSLLLTSVFKSVAKGLTGGAPALPNDDQFYEQAD